MTECKQINCTYAELNYLKLSETIWLCAKNELKLFFKNVIYKTRLEIIYLICIKRI